MRKIQILIVDDSSVVRKALSVEFGKEADMAIAGVAANGRIALSMVEQVSPDVIILDVQMPEMDGLTFLRELRAHLFHVPVIMLSTMTKKGADTTFEALSLGAKDYVTKPEFQNGYGEALATVCGELLAKIRVFCKHLLPPEGHLSKPPVMRPDTPNAVPGKIPEIVVIGVSTGGPTALSQVVPLLSENFPLPILIVQHMPALFTKMLAERLAASSKIRVLEVQGGEVLSGGQVYLAQGGFHMTIERSAKGMVTCLTQTPPVNSCRPSVDVLFESVHALYGARTLAVVMTGMGEDGKRGCEAITASGGFVIAQDEATSVVWGMPGAVVRAGLAGRILPLSEIAPALGIFCRKGALK